MEIDGEHHPHSFLRDGSETRNAEVTSKEGHGITIRSAIVGLLVLKSTGSAFYGFVQDEYTKLEPVWDRILSTEVDCGWSWNVYGKLEDVQSAVSKFDVAWKAARDITLKIFANDSSASVQNTMYKMCDEILAVEPTVESVDYSLPNKHYFEIGE